MKKHLPSTLLAILLSACGFHLKGMNHTAPLLSSINLVDSDYPHQSAYQALEKTLQDNHIDLSETAKWKIVISDYQYQNNTIVDTSSSREAELIASYQIAVFHDNHPIGSTTISNRTNLVYAAGQYLGSVDDQNAAFARLNRDNADASLRYLNAIINQENAKE